MPVLCKIAVNRLTMVVLCFIQPSLGRRHDCGDIGGENHVEILAHVWGTGMIKALDLSEVIGPSLSAGFKASIPG